LNIYTFSEVRILISNYFAFQHNVGRAADWWLQGWWGVWDGQVIFYDLMSSGLVDVDYEVRDVLILKFV